MKIRLEIEGKNAGSINYKGIDCIDLAAAYLNSIEAQEVQVHLVKDDGTKADAEFDGEFPLLSAIKFLQAASKIRNEVPLQTSITNSVNESQKLTLRERLEMFLRFEYPRVWFTSLDVKKQYEFVYGKIGLSTVSTYLARMSHENILIRRGNRNQREYRFKDENNIIHNMEYGLVK
jgi:hypothetical protein